MALPKRNTSGQSFSVSLNKRRKPRQPGPEFPAPASSVATARENTELAVVRGHTLLTPGFLWPSRRF